MDRRKFLQMLGLAPVAAVTVANLPAAPVEAAPVPVAPVAVPEPGYRHWEMRKPLPDVELRAAKPCAEQPLGYGRGSLLWVYRANQIMCPLCGGTVKDRQRPPTGHLKKNCKRAREMDNTKRGPWGVIGDWIVS